MAISVRVGPAVLASPPPRLTLRLAQLHKPESILEDDHKLRWEVFKSEVASPPEDWGVTSRGGGRAKKEETEGSAKEEPEAEVKVAESQSQERSQEGQ